MATQATRSQPGPGSAGRTSGRALGRSAAAAGAAPLTVIVGEEDLLVERAVTAVVRHGAAQAAGEPGSAPDVHDVRGLAAACDQLASDTTGVVTAQVVSTYWRGRAEATGFSVADRALEGNLAEALAQLRWALAIGTAPVLITSALARGIRSLGQVGTARGKGADALAAELGMPAWKVDKIRKQLRGWSSAGLARAHSAVAQADADVKGEGASAGFALERVVRVIVESRSAS